LDGSFEFEVVDLHSVVEVDFEGRSLLQNPFAARVEPDGLRFYFVPEDNQSWLYRYAIE
jgi:hypothetical protein